MATMKLIVAILVLGLAALGSAQWRHQHGYYPYQHYYPQQQRPYPNQYPRGQTGVSVSDAEWVCKNPKTGDMMVIVAEEAPANTRQGLPVQSGYPGYPQQPNYPQPEPNYPQTPTSPPPIQGTTPNAGGEGVIDIRMGRK